MKTTYGFRLERQEDIEELKSTARLYRHAKTGAELLSLLNGDENKVFGITFRTPPSDSTGIAHILEHSVLCGSRKYPVKEPFVELLKGSLHTFLNAFTYPDKTCYPVASQNLQDFYNLIDVYLDAVFYPRLTPFVFQQEGWHYELNDPGDRLSYKGVVFNEMKGAYSSPENVLSEYSLQSLCPGGTYGFDSGGDPRKIPDLTFDRFKRFHETCYHPSNSRIFFYGDDDPDERLKIADDYLKDFDPIKVESTIHLPPAFKSPRRLVKPFMSGEGDNALKRGMVTVNWLLCETSDIHLNFALRILGYILLGMPASPLRKALIDSGLGEDIAGDGLGTEIKRIYFSAGLKGIEIKKSEQVEKIIFETLESLVRKGIDSLTTEAALNTIEFRLRENNPGRYPRGLAIMLKALTTWLYDGDPLALLGFEAPLNRLKSGMEKNGKFFEDLIEKWFLKNRHRSTLILKPDPDLRKQEESDERNRLEDVRTSLGEGDLEAISENSTRLRRLQGTPDPPEALASIPTLKMEDLEKTNRKIPIKKIERGTTPFLYHDLPTNGIIYLDLGFDMHSLPEKYIPYVPLFGRALLEMGTEEEDYVSLTQRISRVTGGIRPQFFTSSVRGGDSSAALLFLRGKSIIERGEDMSLLLSDILLKAVFEDRNRFRQLVLEEKSGAEQGLVPAGHQVINLRIRSHFGEANWAAEQMGGISYLLFLRGLLKQIDDNWKKILEDLEDIRARLINRNSVILNVTLDGEKWGASEPALQGIIESLPVKPAEHLNWSYESPSLMEGFTIPSQINYVGKGAGLYDLGYNFHGSAHVITRFLRNSYLWDRVRVQGGAYGAFCLLHRLSGVLTFVSYRDPNTLNTLQVFDEAAEFLKKAPVRKEEITKSIIGAIGALDSHMLPDAKGYTSMLRYLTGETDEALQAVREGILGTDASHFKAFAGVLEEVRDRGLVKIMGSESSVDSASAEGKTALEKCKLL